MRYRWIEPEPRSVDVQRLDDDALLDRLLASRGLTTRAEAERFLAPASRFDPDELVIPGLDAAVSRIAFAMDDDERIGIFGDYDADGLTSTALLTRALRCAAGDPDRIIPHVPARGDGYGLNGGAIDAFHAAGVSLLIAVDCGSSDHAAVAHARSLGLDVLVVDHHRIVNGTPPGAIVVSAQLDAGDAPARDLAAVGLAYMVVARLAREGYPVVPPSVRDETELLPLVALGTIADLAPLKGLNRSLVRQGLDRMHRSTLAGIRALCRRANVDPTTLSAEQIAFKLAPRLNAPGRLGDPTIVLELLLAADPLTAGALADQIEKLNDERRRHGQLVSDSASSLAATMAGLDGAPVVLVHQDSWPPGLLGLAAARLAEEHGRPAVVLTGSGAQLHGSARSIPGVDISAALAECADLLDRFGGHSQAAGLSLPPANVELLHERLNDILTDLVTVLERPELRLDAEVEAHRLTLDTARTIARLEPHGPGNERPMLLVRRLPVSQAYPVGSDGSHLSLTLQTSTGPVKAIAFRQGARHGEIDRGAVLDVAASIKVDLWNGRERLELDVADFRAAL